MVAALRRAGGESGPIDFQGQIAHLTEDERTFLSGIALDESPEPTEKDLDRLLKALETKTLGDGGRCPPEGHPAGRGRGQWISVTWCGEKETLEKRIAQLNVAERIENLAIVIEEKHPEVQLLVKSGREKGYLLYEEIHQDILSDEATAAPKDLELRLRAALRARHRDRHRPRPRRAPPRRARERDRRRGARGRREDERPRPHVPARDGHRQAPRPRGRGPHRQAHREGRGEDLPGALEQPDRPRRDPEDARERRHATRASSTSSSDVLEDEDEDRRRRRTVERPRHAARSRASLSSFKKIGAHRRATSSA